MISYFSRKIVTFLVIGSMISQLVTGAGGKVSAAEDSKGASIEPSAVIAQIAEKYHAVSLSVAVIENGVVTDTFAYGWATKGTTPMTADTKQRIASISKVILGMETMARLQAGDVSLDEPIGTYWGRDIKNPYYPDTPVTLRTLITHTSSLTVLNRHVIDNATEGRYMESGEAFSNRKPGGSGAWGYNNYAFGILAMTYEQAAGKNTNQLLREDFFTSLGIDASFGTEEIVDKEKICTLYEYGRAVSIPGYPGGNPGDYDGDFAGGLVISAPDLAKMVAILANDGSYNGVQYLEPEMVEIMETKVLNLGSSYQCMPLRNQTNIYGRPELYYHTGSAWGVYNAMSYDPATKDGIVVLTNGASNTKDKYGIYAVCGEIMDYLYNY